jgi:hypothetical protein
MPEVRNGKMANACKRSIKLYPNMMSVYVGVGYLCSAPLGIHFAHVYTQLTFPFHHLINRDGSFYMSINVSRSFVKDQLRRVAIQHSVHARNNVWRLDPGIFKASPAPGAQMHGSTQAGSHT